MHIHITHRHTAHILCVHTSSVCLHIGHACIHGSYPHTHKYASSFKGIQSQVESAFQTCKFLPALKISKARSTCCRVSIPFSPAQPQASQKTLPNTQGQAQRQGSGKILAHGGQAQGKGDRMDSVSSSQQPSPEFPERLVASGRGAWVGAGGGGSKGCGARRGRLDGTCYNSSFVLCFPAPWERQEDYETGVFGNARILAGKRIIQK